MISFETYIEISVDDLDLLYSGFFLYSRNRLLDISGLCTTTDITWCNLRQFFCCKHYNCLLLFCRVWHIFTRKAWCTGTSRYYTKENKVYPQSWLKGCGTLFISFLCMEFAANWHYKLINTASTLAGFCALPFAGHVAHTQKVWSRFTLACPLSIYRFSQQQLLFSGTIFACFCL